MTHSFVCYRCGASLAALSLPFSRQDECPSCEVHLHVCRMCEHFDPHVTRQCREDGADDVSDKERLNFCDWFVPGANAFDPARKASMDAAGKALDALFSGADLPVTSADASDADKLFK
ncbi:MAG TPA: hypothetical protein PKK10_07200 [Woeseiaceae bacterium]|nr:hypothetical protein [Woeseiaceae bacterium]